MKRCANCGWSNEETNRFCENCGADLSRLGQGARPTWQPTPTPPESPLGQSTSSTTLAPWEVPPTSPDWRMAPLPPEEAVPRRRRRTWLWVTGAILGLCLLVCILSTAWVSFTESGQQFATSVAEREAEQRR